jgi:hypothetical protein
MRNAIAAILAVATSIGLTGCDSNAVPGESPMLRYQIDSASNRAWWLTREGAFVNSASQPKAVAIALPEWLWVGAAHGCPPDLALGPKGEAVITSNVVPILWKIDPETLGVTVHRLVLDSDTDKDVGFSGLVYSAEHAAFFASSDIYGSLWKIDPLLKTATKIGRSDAGAARKTQRVSHLPSTLCTNLARRLNQVALNIGG